LPLQSFKQDLMPISCIINFQLLSYLTSIKKDINPDQPRNLAKSVTVE
jgi:glucosamine--fructose-6-phosphate aminotransferase (isomerizing)